MIQNNYENSEAAVPQQPEPQKQPLTFTGKQKKYVVAAGVVVIALLTWFTVSLVLPTEGMKREAVLEACKEDALSKLRDPDSATFDLGGEPELMENKAGEPVYLYAGTVRARNGFGGMDSNHVTCFGLWDDSSEVATGNAAVLDF